MIRTPRARRSPRLKPTKSLRTFWRQILEATGLYKHENGTFVTEKSLRIEILFAQDNQIRDLVGNLKKMFNQESIAVEKSVITSELW